MADEASLAQGLRIVHFTVSSGASKHVEVGGKLRLLFLERFDLAGGGKEKHEEYYPCRIQQQGKT